MCLGLTKRLVLRTEFGEDLSRLEVLGDGQKIEDPHRTRTLPGARLRKDKGSYLVCYIYYQLREPRYPSVEPSTARKTKSLDI